MTSRLRTLFSRAKDIYQEEGLLATVRRIFVFSVSLLSYENSVFYVYERILKRGNEANRLPKIQNFTHRLVDKVEQLDGLLNEGFDLSLLDINQARYRLERGAIVSLIFVDDEFAATSWSALTEEAKKPLIVTRIRLTSQTMRFVVEALGCIRNIVDKVSITIQRIKRNNI